MKIKRYRWRIFTSLLVFLVISFLEPSLNFAQQAKHVILISLDGLRPDYYTNIAQYNLKIPNMREMMRKGSYAKGVVGVFPTLTYTSHTSIATGTYPAKHGIVANRVFNVFKGYDYEKYKDRDWYWQASYIKSKTIWQACKERDLTTAAIFWPVTVGAKIDFLIPEYWSYDPEVNNVELLRNNSTPGIFQSVEEKYGTLTLYHLSSKRALDCRAIDFAEEIITSQKPNLLLIHINDTDRRQHDYGPESPEALVSFEEADAHIGRIVGAAKSAGIFKETVFIVMGDHGFMQTHTRINPNVLLVEKGLIEINSEGKLEDWKAIAFTNGAYAAIYLKNPDDSQMAKKVLDLFQDKLQGKYDGIYNIVTRAQLDELKAVPKASFCLEPEEGYSFHGHLQGDFLLPEIIKGAHGYLPTRKKMETGFIICGSGISQGVVLEKIRLIDIAPTVAKILNVDLSEADGRPLISILDLKKELEEKDKFGIYIAKQVKKSKKRT